MIRDYGPCCACGGNENVRNIMMLPFKAPVPGTGWGCVVCGLPSDGAFALLCDECLASDTQPQMAVRGNPDEGLRVLIESLTGEHEHDMMKHPAAERIEAFLQRREAATQRVLEFLRIKVALGQYLRACEMCEPDFQPFTVQPYRVCRVCGCSDDRPCGDLNSPTMTCSWVTEDLCSSCVQMGAQLSTRGG